jgi:hypothetical protein
MAGAPFCLDNCDFDCLRITEFSVDPLHRLPRIGLSALVQSRLKRTAR